MATHVDQLSAVRISELTRKFGDRTVLDRISLDIAPGEFVALLGHSGSGKRTLLRAIAGLDHDVSDSVSAPERLSMVFQDSPLLPWRWVLSNVILGATGDDMVERGPPRWPRLVWPGAITRRRGDCRKAIRTRIPTSSISRIWPELPNAVHSIRFSWPIARRFFTTWVAGRPG